MRVFVDGPRREKNCNFKKLKVQLLFSFQDIPRKNIKMQWCMGTQSKFCSVRIFCIHCHFLVKAYKKISSSTFLSCIDVFLVFLFLSDYDCCLLFIGLQVTNISQQCVLLLVSGGAAAVVSQSELILKEIQAGLAFFNQYRC